MRYEDLVDKCNTTLAGLYQHLGLEFNREVEDYVHSLTAASQRCYHVIITGFYECLSKKWPLWCAAIRQIQT